jgi:hypothetical protein
MFFTAPPVVFPAPKQSISANLVEPPNTFDGTSGFCIPTGNQILSSNSSNVPDRAAISLTCTSQA